MDLRPGPGGMRDVAQLIDERPLSGFQIRVILLCCLTVLLDGYDIQTMALVVPSLAQEWNMPASAFGVALAASLLGIGLGSAFVAPFGDRWGRRPLIIGGLWLVGVASIATGLASTLPVLLAGRFLTGVGLAMGLTNATALVSDYAPARRRAALVTLMFCNVALGAFSAGFSAPALIGHFGWRSLFIIGGILPLVLGVLLLFALPESLRLLVAGKPGHRAIAPLLARLFPDVNPASIHAQQRDQERDQGQDQIRRRSVAELLSPAYRHRTLLLWYIFCLNLFVLYLLISWLPSLLREAGWEAAAAMRGAVMIQLGGIAGGLLISLAVDKGKAGGALLWAYTVSAASLAAFALLPATPPVWNTLLVVLGAGISGSQLALYALAAGFYPPALRATGLGWSTAIGRAGATAGPVAGGLLIQLQLGATATLGMLAAPLLLCALGAWLLPHNHNRRSA
ncbi:MFS transporter [Pseudoduganella namucuonensis]|uniref:MFS transporter, AAHS family, 4-hydroxybenzoate transporter n=1 Tax=Pseudoduganella namucuonensis TaxID=1035707 RepID=A0A1I7LDX3_9BURK|nr:MFS transporter [Pseudoduganella namucuonensis]SFV07898.1 MFS transporter, AAHS family, 4-hydroxybenzoate transporter [Pseudoduganella namucuonensis]